MSTSRPHSRNSTPIARRPLGQFVVSDDLDWASARAAAAAELRELDRRGPFLRDLVGRNPSVRQRRIDPLLRIHIGAVTTTNRRPPCSRQ
jgi:hypothetical protein